MRSSFGLLFLVLLAACAQGSRPHPGVGDAHSVGEALTVCPAGATVQGADVSSYQDTIDWGNVAADGGLTFAIAKATEGLTVQDADFAANWSGMQAHGLIRGAYHFFHPGDDGAAQADYFLAQVGGFQPGDLPPFLDWEVIDSSTAQESITAAQNFINEIQAKTGLTTVIYTYPDFWENTLGDPSQFAGYPVWWANYVSCPDLPSTWSAWQFWQYSSTATVPGMNCPGACDVDEFNGSAEDLQAFALAAQGNCGVAAATCGADAGCCYGLTCEAGTCQPPPCSTDGGTCSADGDCCTGLTCQSGSCQPPPDCTAISGACTEASDCCSGMTCLTWTPSGGTAGTYCCDGVGAACGDSRDCCGGSLCSSSGVCLCVPADTYCQNDIDCCAGLTCDPGSSNCVAAPATSSSSASASAASSSSSSSAATGSTGRSGSSGASASGTSTGGSSGRTNASATASGTSGSSGTQSAATVGATDSTGGSGLVGFPPPDAGSGAEVSSRGCSSSAGDVGLWSVLASASLGLHRRRRVR